MSRRQQIKKNLRPGVSAGFQAGLGRQLSSRVSSGALTQKQAGRTARQRKTLAAAFGSDWRTKVYGKGGAKGITGPFARPEIAGLRATALQQAQQKLAKAKFKKKTKAIPLAPKA